MQQYPLFNKVMYSIAQGGLEYFLIVSVAVYGINYTIGYRRNLVISKRWLDDVKQVIFLNFAMVGTGDESK